MRRIAIGLILAVVTLAMSGCTALLVASGAALGAGTAVYLQGDLEKTLDAEYDQVWVASQKALQGLDVTITAKEEKTNVGTLKGKLMDDRAVVVKVEPQTKGRTKISIRVGVVGDETESRKILDAIERRL